jgi:hypothetical protein
LALEAATLLKLGSKFSDFSFISLVFPNFCQKMTQKVVFFGKFCQMPRSISKILFSQWKNSFLSWLAGIFQTKTFIIVWSEHQLMQHCRVKIFKLNRNWWKSRNWSFLDWHFIHATFPLVTLSTPNFSSSTLSQTFLIFDSEKFIEMKIAIQLFYCIGLEKEFDVIRKAMHLLCWDWNSILKLEEVYSVVSINGFFCLLCFLSSLFWLFDISQSEER